jgi:hypothetical protein
VAAVAARAGSTLGAAGSADAAMRTARANSNQQEPDVAKQRIRDFCGSRMGFSFGE